MRAWLESGDPTQTHCHTSFDCEKMDTSCTSTWKVLHGVVSLTRQCGALVHKHYILAFECEAFPIRMIKPGAFSKINPCMVGIRKKALKCRTGKFLRNALAIGPGTARSAPKTFVYDMHVLWNYHEALQRYDIHECCSDKDIEDNIHFNFDVFVVPRMCASHLMALLSPSCAVEDKVAKRWLKEVALVRMHHLCDSWCLSFYRNCTFDRCFLISS